VHEQIPAGHVHLPPNMRRWLNWKEEGKSIDIRIPTTIDSGMPDLQLQSIGALLLEVGFADPADW